MHEKGQGVAQDYAAALNWYRKAADQGLAVAQNNLGMMHEKGQGVAQDYAAALNWYRKAADQGYAPAQHSLGFMYDSGRGVLKDDVAAASWYRKAADQGDAHAQSNLGIMYAQGRGVTQDYAAALNWYRKAADQGDAHAQNNLGAMHEKGQGVAQDYAAALNWYRKAADQGLAIAQNNLGMMYEKGQGVRQDNATALNWFRRAADQGYAPAKNILAVMPAPKSVKPAEKPIEQTVAKPAEDRNPITGRSQTALPKIIKPLPFDVQPTASNPNGLVSVPLEHKHGIYTVRVLINNSIYLDAVVDSGATDVAIPANVVMRLVRAGTIAADDFLGAREYMIADGSTRRSETFRIRSLKVGSKMAENITGNVATANADLLLGQSFLSRFKSFSIDNTRHVLILE
jgi:clan AA aspartic protease (TIGR02281 family)